MASRTEIANRALSKLGAARLIDVDTDNNKAARAMQARLDILIETELEAHPWRFSIQRTTLPALSEAPAWGYSKKYARPTDDLRPVTIGDLSVNVATLGVQYSVSTGYNPSQAPFEVIGQEIHTDLTAPLKYEYVRRVTNTGEFSPLFVEALACRIAMDAAEEITQSETKADRATRMYSQAIREARRINALYRPPGDRDPGGWFASRFGT